MAKLTKEQIEAVLREISVPGEDRNLMETGWIEKIDTGWGGIMVSLCLPAPAKLVGETLSRAICERLGKEHRQKCSVKLTHRVRAIPVLGKQALPGIKNVVAVASGKGGVGKSTVCANLALALHRAGARVGLLDCDLYGPSVPSLFGIHERIQVNGRQQFIPHQADGIGLLSLGFMIDPGQPVSWRGPMLHKMLQQLFANTAWGELDYLLLDLPPGTGDVQLTLTQAMPLSASVLVTTPQRVALLDVKKGYEMFREVGVPIAGIIENMSYYLCRNCEKKHRIFKEGGAEKLAGATGLPVLGEIPLDPLVPSSPGEGKPVVARDPDGSSAQAFQQAAESLAFALAMIPQSGRQVWAKPGPNALEV